MSTREYASPLKHTTTAEFRAWAGEFSSNLQLVNTTIFKKTNDSGQIDFNTVSLPTTGNVAGYEIYSLNDGVGLPIYLKIEYATSNNVGYPFMFLTVGSGSNGAGTLNGVLSTRKSFMTDGATFRSSSENYLTKICVLPGYIGVMFKMNIQSNDRRGLGYFVVCRTITDTGELKTDATIVIRNQTLATAFSSFQVLNKVTGIATDEHTAGMNSLVPQGIKASGANDINCFYNFISLPMMRPVFGCITLLLLDIERNTTITFTPSWSSTPRTYVCLGAAAAYHTATNPTGACMAMLWE